MNLDLAHRDGEAGANGEEGLKKVGWQRFFACNLVILRGVNLASSSEMTIIKRRSSSDVQSMKFLSSHLLDSLLGTRHEEAMGRKSNTVDAVIRTAVQPMQRSTYSFMNFFLSYKKPLLSVRSGVWKAWRAANHAAVGMGNHRSLQHQ
ncbi:hypothetical protein [Halotalea alkalilenta]|uniref:hypothetical protein n=1 Tax=Halotalea alkalilenta TaxID=376489 RepID=UPI00123766B0|nr:hypothetical protein [Halotalea alkalilenta]